jgi:hypothetical protein
MRLTTAAVQHILVLALALVLVAQVAKTSEVVAAKALELVAAAKALELVAAAKA